MLGTHCPVPVLCCQHQDCGLATRPHLDMQGAHLTCRWGDQLVQQLSGERGFNKIFWLGSRLSETPLEETTRQALLLQARDAGPCNHFPVIDQILAGHSKFKTALPAVGICMYCSMAAAHYTEKHISASVCETCSQAALVNYSVSSPPWSDQPCPFRAHLWWQRPHCSPGLHCPG